MKILNGSTKIKKMSWGRRSYKTEVTDVSGIFAGDTAPTDSEWGVVFRTYTGKLNRMELIE